MVLESPHATETQMCATAHEGLDLKDAVSAAHHLRRVHLG
jgi:hypothetical protein